MRMFLLLPMALLVFAIVSPVMSAPAIKTSFIAEASFVPGNISQGSIWTTKDGIQHVRGAVSEGTITGDLTGTFLIISYETVDFNTGEGVNHGKFTLILDGGTFEGSFQSTISMYTFSGTFVGHGTDTYKGQKLMGLHEGELILDTIPVVQMTLEGIMLSPKG